MSRLVLYLITALLFDLTTNVARAEQAKPADMTAEDRIEVERIEDYLNGLTTAKAGFTQAGTNGAISTGTFYLSRPGRLRFEYAAPNKDVIVADGKLIWYYDSKLKEANHAPVSRTLANFLLRSKIELIGGDVTVTDFQRSDSGVTVAMTQTNDPGAGSLAVTFAEHPLQISQWRVVDAQGRSTRVALDHPQFGIALDPVLFKYSDPADQ